MIAVRYECPESWSRVIGYDLQRSSRFTSRVDRIVV
jgi:hypothetical protein